MGKRPNCLHRNLMRRRGKKERLSTVHLEMHHRKAILSLPSRDNVINQIHLRSWISIHLFDFSLSQCQSVTPTSNHVPSYYPKCFFILVSYLYCIFSPVITTWQITTQRYLANCPENIQNILLTAHKNGRAIYLRLHWHKDITSMQN